MPFRVHCPKGCRFFVPQRQAGEVVVCPKCHSVLQIPDKEIIARISGGKEQPDVRVKLATEAERALAAKKRAQQVQKDRDKVATPPKPATKPQLPTAPPLVDSPLINPIPSAPPNLEPATQSHDTPAKVAVSALSEVLPPPISASAPPVPPPLPSTTKARPFQDLQSEPIAPPIVSKSTPVAKTEVSKSLTSQESKPKVERESAKSSETTSQISRSAFSSKIQGDSKLQTESGTPPAKVERKKETTDRLNESELHSTPVKIVPKQEPEKNARIDQVSVPAHPSSVADSPPETSDGLSFAWLEKIDRHNQVDFSSIAKADQAVEASSAGLEISSPFSIELNSTRVVELESAQEHREFVHAKQSLASMISFSLVGLAILQLYFCYAWGFLYSTADPVEAPRNWSLLLGTLSLVMIVYAIFLVQVNDWSAFWVVAIANLAAAFVFVSVSIGLFIGGSQGQMALSLELPSVMVPKATIWCLIVVILVGSIGYWCGHEALVWRKHERLAKLHRLPDGVR